MPDKMTELVPASVLTDIRRMIDSARARAAAAVNAEPTLLYWQVGRRIRDDVLGGERAGYGQQILPELARQLELYLRWLAKHEQEADEAPPIGIILCAGKKQEQIELLELGKSGIHVAEYLTVLPPRETLQAKLHQSIAAARA